MAAIKKEASSKAGVNLTLVLFIGIILANLVLPLVSLLVKSVDYTPFYSGFVEVLTGKTTQTAIKNSFVITTISAIFATVAAFFYAYLVEIKMQRKYRKICRFWAVLPMLVPSISHGIVIVYLFGKMGIFTRLTGLALPIYGPLGIVMGSFFYAFPTAFLVFSQALSSLDQKLFENADILGASRIRQFVDIILPLMKYSIFSAFSVCFTMIFTDYGIPLSVGGTYSILPLLFYKNVIGLLDFSKGAIFSTILLVPALAVYALDVGYFGKRQAALSGNIKMMPPRVVPFYQKVIFLGTTAVITVPIVIIVLAPFITGWPYNPKITLEYFRQVFQVGRLGSLLLNSLIIAFLTSAVGTLLSFATGYIYTRVPTANRSLKKANHALYMLTLAVPGLALGLAFALFYKGTFIYNTLAIMIMVNVIHFFGSPYMMMNSHFKLLNPGLEAVCTTLGGKWYNIIFDIIVPTGKKVITDVFVYFFTNTMITISAISLLYTSKTTTLALKITAYSDQGNWEQALAVSLVILVINVALKYFQTFRASASRI